MVKARDWHHRLNIFRFSTHIPSTDSAISMALLPVTDPFFAAAGSTARSKFHECGSLAKQDNRRRPRETQESHLCTSGMGGMGWLFSWTNAWLWLFENLGYRYGWNASPKEFFDGLNTTKFWKSPFCDLILSSPTMVCVFLEKHIECVGFDP